MAYVIPITGLKGEKGDRGPVCLIVVLTRENLMRMRQADPFDFQLRNVPGLGVHDLNELDLIIAYEEDASVLLKYQKTGDLKAIVEWVERGRRHRPGDASPPIHLPRKQKSN